MNFLKISDLAYKEFKQFLEDNNVNSKVIRIYLAGMSCHGPSFNISVGEQTEEDLTQQIGDIIFLLDKSLFLQFSGFILLSGKENGLGGFTLEPLNKPEISGCGGCSGCSSCEDGNC